MKAFDLSSLMEEHAASGQLYTEILRVPNMSAGIYELAAGAEDPQTPHQQDEIYYVVRGRGVIQVGDEDRAIRPGTIVYVPAHEEHRFHSIIEDLTLLVVFAPAET